MSTIDWPEGESQTYVNVEDGQVRVDDDHKALGKRSTTLAPADARQLAVAHRRLADALDNAADRALATRVEQTFARLEALIGTHNRLGDTDAVTAQVAKVRALLDGLEPEPEQPALEQFPVIT